MSNQKQYIHGKNARPPALKGLVKGAFLFMLALIPVTAFTGAQLENHDAFCASCHTEPEATYYDRSTAASAIDLASFHHGEATRCVDCHSGQGVTGRVQAFSLGGHDLLKYLSGNYPQPSPQTQPIQDVNCLKCHADISKQQTFNNHFHAFLPQWQEKDANAATCVDCHQAHVTNGAEQIAFLNQEHTTAICQSCHSFAGRRG